MFTLVLTYRNRDLRIVKNCLDSLAIQSSSDFSVILVDYGSEPEFSAVLQIMCKTYDFVSLLMCPVSEQLWNKSRAINMVLQQTTTSYFLVGDIDLLFHPDFIKRVATIASSNLIYFKCGFLSQKESLLNKTFEAYNVAFTGSSEVTGIILAPTTTLKKVQGYDEFYHGWGAEDTDMHMRLKNAGVAIKFYDEAILVKHQWHPKAYRSKKSRTPFHSNLERINHKHMLLSQTTKRTVANVNNKWGLLPNMEAYNKLNRKPSIHYNCSPSTIEFSAVLAQLSQHVNEVVKVSIHDVSLKEKARQVIKKYLNKKFVSYWSMETVNNLLLESIIVNYRNLPYRYTFNRVTKRIELIIVF